jgi:hypothetical protein
VLPAACGRLARWCPLSGPSADQLPELLLLALVLLGLGVLEVLRAPASGGEEEAEAPWQLAAEVAPLSVGWGAGAWAGAAAAAAAPAAAEAGAHAAAATSAFCSLVPPLRLCIGAGVSGYWLLSFLGACACLRGVQAGYFLRQLRSVLLVVHKGVAPPPYLRLSDGGLCENTGLLQLLARRQRWVVVVDASHDPALSLTAFRNAMQLAGERQLCSFYDPACPERAVEVLLAGLARGEHTHVRLGVRYGWASEEEGLGYRGELFLIKVGAPRTHEQPVPPPISAEELLRGPDPLAVHPRLRLRRGELRGCCCDACHAACSPCACAERFPFYSSATQCFSRTLFSAFTRLGFELASPVVEDLMARQAHAGPQAPPAQPTRSGGAGAA